MDSIALVTLLAVFLTLYFSNAVGKLRKDVKAPATTGNETFERAFRVHANTVEQLVLFLPALWLATPALPDHIAAGIGAVWLVGRILFARGYMEEPSKRSKGMWLTFLSTAALWLAAMAGVFGLAI